MTHDSALLDKIRAILRKADASKNPSEEERDTAVRAANRLLLKHGLTMQDVGSVEDDTTPAGRAFEHEPEFTTESDHDEWRGNLLFRIAPVYFCHAYFMQRGDGRQKYRWYIIGRGDHAAAVRVMHAWIAPQIEREFNVAASKMTQHRRYARRWALHAATVAGLSDVENYVEEVSGGSASVQVTNEDLARIGREYFEITVQDIGLDATLDQIMALLGCNRLNAERTRAKIKNEDIAPASPANLGVWRRSFFHAAGVRIKTRLREMMREEVQDLGNQGSALVKNERAALKKFMDEDLSWLNLSSTSGGERDAEGVAAGLAAANRADLSPHNKVSVTARKELNA